MGTAIAEIRRLAHGIYPPLLISGGLAEALPALVARASVPVQLDLGPLDRPPSTEAAFYYCCSEALQNAAKHGGPATTVTVTAVADEQALTLTISDTGSGFHPTTLGMGLTNMTDRLSAIGGRLEIDTAPGSGTRITAAVDSGGAGQLARVTGVHTTTNRVAHTVAQRDHAVRQSLSTPATSAIPVCSSTGSNSKPRSVCSSRRSTA